MNLELPQNCSPFQITKLKEMFTEYMLVRTVKNGEFFCPPKITWTVVECYKANCMWILGLKGLTKD